MIEQVKRFIFNLVELSGAFLVANGRINGYNEKEYVMILAIPQSIISHFKSVITIIQESTDNNIQVSLLKSDTESDIEEAYIYIRQYE